MSDSQGQQDTVVRGRPSSARSLAVLGTGWHAGLAGVVVLFVSRCAVAIEDPIDQGGRLAWPGRLLLALQIGRASCRERVSQQV